MTRGQNFWFVLLAACFLAFVAGIMLERYIAASFIEHGPLLDNVPALRRAARHIRRYPFIFRQNIPAIPINPVPSMDIVPGSGVVSDIPDPVIEVLPDEMNVFPLKNPLPVLIVNCTVTP